MDTSIRSKLLQLKEVAQSESCSQIPGWLKAAIIENVDKLLVSNASNRRVAENLVGGLRAILDGASPDDDDPILTRMTEIINEAESRTNPPPP
jgi:hypothetical protein